MIEYSSLKIADIITWWVNHIKYPVKKVNEGYY